jgi:hypothetical protein
MCDLSKRDYTINNKGRQFTWFVLCLGILTANRAEGASAVPSAQVTHLLTSLISLGGVIIILSSIVPCSRPDSGSGANVSILLFHATQENNFPTTQRQQIPQTRRSTGDGKVERK